MNVKRVMGHLSPRSDERFELFFNENHARVRAYVARRVEANLVDDVALSTFAVAWRKFATAPEPSLAWVLSIAGYELRNAARRERRLAAAAPAWLERAEGEVEVVDVEPLRSAFTELAPGDQEILRLVHWDQLSREEIATVLGLSVGTVNVRYHRAKARLENRIVEHKALTETEVHQ